ncbi:MAG TPA: hypothetical protein VKX25_08770 [Bryobacteraceae bacterium]|jgi:hypothetical protein|nr:hypothetical protein [Bryobacteraceae bacterium]
MSVFQGNVHTPTASNGISRDSATPKLGALNLGAMTSVTAVSGTNGVDSKLIHGDRWQEIQGNQTENIKNDLKTHILQNQQWTIEDNLDFKVNGETTDNRIGEVKEYYHSGSRFEYIGEHTDLHHEQDHQINPTHTFDILNVEGEYKNIDFAVKASSIEAKGIVLDATVAKAEAWGAGAEAWGAQVGAGGFANEAVALDVKEKAAEEEMKGVHNDIAALNAQIGAARTIIMPVRVGICIAVHIDSPWA